MTVDTEAACRYTGRPRTVLYRWRREGRLTVHRDARGRPLWDLRELPAHVPGQPLPEPPPVHRRVVLDAIVDQVHY